MTLRKKAESHLNLGFLLPTFGPFHAGKICYKRSELVWDGHYLSWQASVTEEVRLDPLVEEDFEKAEAEKVQHCFQRHQMIEHRFAQVRHQREENKGYTSSLTLVAVGTVVAETFAAETIADPSTDLATTPLAMVGPSARQFRVNLIVLIAIAIAAAAAAAIVAAAAAVVAMAIESAAVDEADISSHSVVALSVAAALGVDYVNAEVEAVAALEASCVVVLGAVAVVGGCAVVVEAAIVAAAVVVVAEDETSVPDLEKVELNQLKEEMHAGCCLAVASHPLNHPAVLRALELLARVSTSSWEPSAL